MTTPKMIEVGVDGHRYTDSGNADRLIAHHGDALRYVPAWDRWQAWDGRRWATDTGSVHVTELAKDVGRRLIQAVPNVDQAQRAKLVQFANRTESAAGIAALIRLARSVPGVAIDHTDLDADRWTLNVANGIVDLRTGRLHPHDPEALCTRMAPVELTVGARSPLFDSFLERIIPDADVRAYLQRFAGYCLTGDVSAQVIAMWWGAGRNGKSVLVAILRALLGDYAAVAARELLTVQRHDGHPTILADLFRARLATCVELRDGAALDEARVKALTGGDAISARRMREDPWWFEPTHKLVVATNHRPTVHADDFALWRRVHLVPFSVTIPASEVDPHLAERIIDGELAGVLRWALDGLADWRTMGLSPPNAVLAATEEYRAQADTVARFLDDEQLGFAGDLRIDSAALVHAHERWCTENGIEQRAHWQDVQRRLKDRGAIPRRGHAGRWWAGVGFVAEPTGETIVTVNGTHRAAEQTRAF